MRIYFGRPPPSAALNVWGGSCGEATGPPLQTLLYVVGLGVLLWAVTIPLLRVDAVLRHGDHDSVVPRQLARHARAAHHRPRMTLSPEEARRRPGKRKRESTGAHKTGGRDSVSNEKQALVGPGLFLFGFWGVSGRFFGVFGRFFGEDLGGFPEVFGWFSGDFLFILVF